MTKRGIRRTLSFILALSLMLSSASVNTAFAKPLDSVAGEETPDTVPEEALSDTDGTVVSDVTADQNNTVSSDKTKEQDATVSSDGTENAVSDNEVADPADSDGNIFTGVSDNGAADDETDVSESEAASDNKADAVSDSTSQATDTGEITGIDKPEKTEYSFEYKMILETLMKELPGTLKVWRGKESGTIKIIWKCEDDYDKELEEYTFVPDLDSYALAEDLELPRITVTYEKKRPRHTLIDFDMDMNSYDVPFVDDGNGLNAANLPDKYINKKLPAVRNQDPYGTCWAFATIAAMEADLIHDGKTSKSIDLSELHMIYYAGNYLDPKKCRKDKVSYENKEAYFNYGGWINSGTHLLSNHVGAVKESVAPYGDALTISNKLKNTAYVTSKDSYQLDKAYFYNTQDITSVKKAIKAHGAVMIAYFDSDSFYSYKYNSYYRPYKAKDEGGHQVVIVGWDDNFSRTNFVSGNGYPNGNGAWLIRNSWGKNEYDRDGYFWMSYYDTGLKEKTDAVAYDVVGTPYKYTYAYDGQNHWDKVLEVKSGSIQKVTYSVAAGEAVKAVGFEVGSTNVKADITVKNKKTGKSSTGSISCSSAGFYTVKLKNPVPVPSKATIEVSIRYTTDSGKITLINEQKFKGSVKGVDAVLNFNTVCDKGFTINGSKKSYDPRVKVYTVDNIKVNGVKLDRTKVAITQGKTCLLKATVKPTNATNKGVTWTSSNTKVATVNSSGKVTAKKAGTATITVKTKDGKKTAKCKVTVKKAK